MVDNALTEKVLLATGGYDHTIKLWHANTGVCNRSLTHLDSVSFKTSLNEHFILHKVICKGTCLNLIIFSFRQINL